MTSSSKSYNYIAILLYKYIHIYKYIIYMYAHPFWSRIRIRCHALSLRFLPSCIDSFSTDLSIGTISVWRLPSFRAHCQRKQSINIHLSVIYEYGCLLHLHDGPAVRNACMYVGSTFVCMCVVSVCVHVCIRYISTYACVIVCMYVYMLSIILVYYTSILIYYCIGILIY